MTRAGATHASDEGAGGEAKATRAMVIDQSVSAHNGLSNFRGTRAGSDERGYCGVDSRYPESVFGTVCIALPL